MIFTLSNAAWYPGGGARCTPPVNMPQPDLFANWLRTGTESAGEWRRPVWYGQRPRGPQALGQSETSIMQSLTPEKLPPFYRCNFSRNRRILRGLCDVGIAAQ